MKQLTGVAHHRVDAIRPLRSAARAAAGKPAALSLEENEPRRQPAAAAAVAEAAQAEAEKLRA